MITKTRRRKEPAPTSAKLDEHDRASLRLLASVVKDALCVCELVYAAGGKPPTHPQPLLSRSDDALTIATAAGVDPTRFEEGVAHGWAVLRRLSPDWAEALEGSQPYVDTANMLLGEGPPERDTR